MSPKQEYSGYKYHSKRVWSKFNFYPFVFLTHTHTHTNSKVLRKHAYEEGLTFELLTERNGMVFISVINIFVYNLTHIECLKLN